jgi:hypothetical protein
MNEINKNDWKRWVDVEIWPYKGGMYGCLSDPKYIKDREQIEKENGNGWWWNEGRGWTMYWESPMEYHKRKRKERGLK